MRDYDMATPVVLLKDGEYRMQLDLLVGTDDEVAAAFEAAAHVIRRIQGTADDEKLNREGDFTRADADLREMAQILSDSHPNASSYLNALADWLLTDDDDDFQPPADTDAIAAAEKRGAALEREAVVEWLLTAKVTSDAPYISKCIERGDHLDGESDDS